jgi:hypothetical protein
MSDNQERIAILNRVNRVLPLRRLMARGHISARELADFFLKFIAIVDGDWCGPPRFTGNNRVFLNGAIGYEVRCKRCLRTFWVTQIPYAICVDCR